MVQWGNHQDKNVRKISSIGEKHLMQLSMKHQIGWRNMRRSSKVILREISLQKQKLITQGPKHLELFMLSYNKSVAALKGTAENKENQSMETQKWLTARKLAVNLKNRRLPREIFQPANIADNAFRKQKAFPRRKVVSSTNLPQMSLRMNTDVCGERRCYKEMKPLRLKSFSCQYLRFFCETF